MRRSSPKRRPNTATPSSSSSAPHIITLSETPSRSTNRRRRKQINRGCGSILFFIAVAIFCLCIVLYKRVGWQSNTSEGSERRIEFEATTKSPTQTDDSNDDESNYDNARNSRIFPDKSDFPDGWERYSYNDIRNYFNCWERSKDNNKPLPTLEDWQLMRDTYTQVVDNTKRWDDDPVPPTLGYSLKKGIPVPPPYYAKLSHGKGRGLFASRDIEKGELVHVGYHSDVIFPSPIAWRKFVFSLPPPFACDQTDWHWMQRLEEGGPYRLIGSLNISSLMNSGGIEFGPGRMPNLLPSSSTSGDFYATKDIEKGEEILTDYDAYTTNWKLVGL